MLSTLMHPHAQGLVTFKESIDSNIISELVQVTLIKELINDEDWDITANRYRTLIQSGFLECIDSAKVKQLKMRWNSACKILTSIKSVSFPFTKELHLNGNDILSIQPLSLIDFSSLTVLNFKENSITHVKGLRKCKMPNLTDITLYKNKMIEFEGFQEISSKKLIKLWITPQNESYNLDNNLGWAFKLQSTKIKHIYVLHRFGICSNFDKIKQMMREKYGDQLLKMNYTAKDDIGVRLQ